jgi:hypothetical protein
MFCCVVHCDLQDYNVKTRSEGYKRLPKYHYLALFVCQLIKLEIGRDQCKGYSLLRKIPNYHYSRVCLSAVKLEGVKVVV